MYSSDELKALGETFLKEFDVSEADTDMYVYGDLDIIITRELGGSKIWFPNPEEEGSKLVFKNEIDSTLLDFFLNPLDRVLRISNTVEELYREIIESVEELAKDLEMEEGVVRSEFIRQRGIEVKLEREYDDSYLIDEEGISLILTLTHVKSETSLMTEIGSSFSRNFIESFCAFCIEQE